MDKYFDNSNKENGVLLIILENGGLKELKCPIPVFSDISFEDFPSHQTVLITAVQSSKDDGLNFIISGKAYKHSHFYFIEDVFRKMRC